MSKPNASADAATLKYASRREIARSATAATQVAAIVRTAASRAVVARTAAAGASVHSHRLVGAAKSNASHATVSPVASASVRAGAVNAKRSANGVANQSAGA